MCRENEPFNFIGDKMTGQEYYKTVTANKDYLYVLRRTIVPWRWRESLKEAVECCEKYHIDELCVFIDSGTFTHYYPNEKWLKNYQEILFAIKNELESHGIVYSLNPNVTQGHGDRGRRIDLQHPDWDMCTDANGISAQDCACSISEGWRNYIKMQWRLYAETKPAVIWIEDDIRSFGHGPVRSGCFCKTHVRRFNEQYGLSLSPAEIQNAVSAQGRPSPIREKWFSFLKQVTEEVITMMTETVHEISPETVIGLMESGVDSHMMESRDWPELYRRMSEQGKQYTASRPPLGNYLEYGLLGLHYTHCSTLLVRKAYGDALRDKIIEEGEIENFPYTNYSKSNRFLFLQNTISIGTGSHAVTLNLFDHSGTPMREYEEILQSLSDMKPFLSALKEKYPKNGKARGLSVYYDPNGGIHKHLGMTHCGGTVSGDTAIPVEMLENLGFSVVFGEKEAVTVLAGQTIRGASEKEIFDIFSRGVFVDAAAFLSLTEMGYGDLLGGTLTEHFPLNTKYPIGGEHFFAEDFGGDKEFYFDTAIHTARPEFCSIQPDKSSRVISSMADIDLNEMMSCCYLYKNRLGGRVAVYPVELAGLDIGFCTARRKKMLANIFKWLGDNSVPLFLNGTRRMLPFRTDGENSALIALYDLSLDDIDQTSAEIFLEHSPRKIEKLTISGVWETYENWQWSNRLLRMDIPHLEWSLPQYFNVQF